VGRDLAGRPSGQSGSPARNAASRSGSRSRPPRSMTEGLAPKGTGPGPGSKDPGTRARMGRRSKVRPNTKVLDRIPGRRTALTAMLRTRWTSQEAHHGRGGPGPPGTTFGRNREPGPTTASRSGSEVTTARSTTEGLEPKGARPGPGSKDPSTRTGTGPTERGRSSENPTAPHADGRPPR
jgi:hypothetical protein